MPSTKRSRRATGRMLQAGFLLSLLQTSSAFHTNRMFSRDVSSRPAQWGPPTKRDGAMAPLRITNKCGETLWPGIGTQAGTGPGKGGFELAAGKSMDFMVSVDWQGRVWGRTNCTFTPDGKGPLNAAANMGHACDSGDCLGVLDCKATGISPASLAEYDLAGGTDGNQAFYDISLVDGYNLPIGIVFLPGNDTKLARIPPNLTNAVCIATGGYTADPSPMGDGEGSNASYPVPYEPNQTNMQLESWCPWNLLLMQPDKPGDGVYPYPDDMIKRPTFDPCNSACAKSNAPADCCTGSYGTHGVCQPNMYSKQAKTICPDAYSFPFDDEGSTFIIPSGGGFETIFCPEGRSTNILNTYKQQLQDLTGAPGIKTMERIDADARNTTIILEAVKKSSADRSIGEKTMTRGSMGALVMVVVWAVLW